MFKLDNYQMHKGEKLICHAESVKMIERGHVVICGEVGSGKSSLIKSLINFDQYQGKISFQDQDIKDLLITKYCGYIPQNLEYYFICNTVVDEIKFSTGRTTEQVIAYLADNNLSEKAYYNPSLLSGGEQIRLALLIANINAVAVMILDETLTNNDYQNLLAMRKEVSKFSKQGLVIEVTHDFDEIIQADQILFIDNGEIVDIKQEELYKNSTAIKLWRLYDCIK